MKDTRNYGKPRFAAGGVVPPGDYKESQRWTGERASGGSLQDQRIEDINKYGNPKDYELEKNRKSSVVQEPDKDYEPEAPVDDEGDYDPGERRA